MSAPQDAGSGVRPARLGQSRRQLRCAEALASAASPAAEVLIDCPSTGGILAAQRRGRSFLTPFPLFKNDTASRWGGRYCFGAGSGVRTRTVLLPTDFKSVMSASSIIPAKCEN